jgi:hypothetical protein
MMCESNQMGEGIKIKTHPAPAWRDKADFLVHAKVEDSTALLEQLWVRQITENRFEICCIPFFVYDLALGDEVETSQEGDMQYVVQSVISRSGHYTFRIWLGDSLAPDICGHIAAELTRLGSTIEWYSNLLLAADAVTASQAEIVANFLWNEEQKGRLIYETGR